MSIYGWFQGPGPSGFGYNSTADEVVDGLDLAGRTYLLTGCNSGLGEDALRVLLGRGARVIATARTEEKAAAAIAGLGGDGVPLACELSEPDSVRAAVKQVIDLGHPLAGIIANAGIMALPQRTVKHGHELQFLTNHIGHYLLVTGLLEQLDADGRVVMLSSTAHMQAPPEGIRFDDVSFEKGYSPWASYGQSKLANLLFAKHLATRLPQPTQTANSVHPGVIMTNLARHWPRFVSVLGKSLGTAIALKTVPQGSATEVYVATHPDAAKHNGEYWADCNVATPSKPGRDAALAARLWEETEKWVAAL
ncbi:MAG: SDR family NAD(P)-dependent oxidoreductase [Alphaproteobacteria bacterium]|nr:SDR family NAD(P)-dependent oxidoreductase [Alphaproteobacteria bacterium]